MKKIISIILSASMLAGLLTTVCAAENESPIKEISNIGATVENTVLNSDNVNEAEKEIEEEVLSSDNIGEVKEKEVNDGILSDSNEEEESDENEGYLNKSEKDPITETEEATEKNVPSKNSIEPEESENEIELFGTEDLTVFNETFDENMGEFVSSGRSTETIKYTDLQNHTAGKNAGAICMGLHGLGMSNFSQSACYGVDRKLGGKIEAGKTYVVSAYIKGETGRYNSGFKFAMGIYKKFNTDINISTLKDITANGNVQVTVTDDWQRIVYLWTPESSSENYSDYRIRINPVNGQRFNEGDKNYDIFYIDDVSICEASTTLELLEVKPENGEVLTPSNNVITADFSMPLGNDNEVTVRNSSGNVVPCTIKADLTKLSVFIPNRINNEIYTVFFDKVTAFNGAVFTGDKTYSYTADQTFLKAEFDESMDPFMITNYLMAVPDCAEYTDKENHTEGKDSGSVRLGLYSDNNVYMINRLSASFGIDKKLGSGIEAGGKYVVSAYIKGEPGRYNSGFKFSMGIYKFHHGSYIKDQVRKYPVSITVSDEWQKIAFLWTPTDSSQNYADYSIRINPVNEQSFNGGIKENNLYDIFYIDDVSIEMVDSIYVLQSQSYPHNGETGVSVDGEFTVKINKQINSDMFKSEYVKLYDVENDLYIDCTSVVDGDTIKIKTVYPLLFEHKYKIMLDHAISSDPEGFITLDADTEMNFTTQKNVISYSTVSARDGKITLKVSNNTAADVTAYAVAAVYENGLCIKNAAIPVTLAANERDKITEINTGLTSITSYEIYFWDKADGDNIKSLANVENKSSARTQIIADSESFQAGYYVNDDRVEIKGRTKEKRVGLPVIVRIVREKDTADGVVFSELVRAEEIISGADGYIAYSFKVPKESDALRFKVYINETDGMGQTELTVTDFVYASQENIKEALKKIDKSSIEDMHKTFTDTENGTKFSVRETLNLMIAADFDKVSGKDYIYRCIEEGKVNGEYAVRGIDSFTEVFNNALKTVVLAEGDTFAAAADIKDNHASDYWKISQNGETSTLKAFLNDFDNTTKAKVLSRLIKTSNGFNDNDNAFNFAVVTENILMGDYNTVVSSMNKFSDIFMVNYTTYNSLTTKAKESVNNKFYNAVSAVDSLDILAAKFEEFAVDAKKNNSFDDNGKGGSGSGSGGRGAYLPGMSNTEKPVPEWYVDENTVGDKNVIFKDLENAQWAVKYINRLYDMGAINGKSEGIYAPSDNMTREELCKVIVLAFGLTAQESKEAPQFDDVDQSKWYAEYIKICSQNGVINGVGENLFGMGRTVTREEVSAILVRAAESAGIALDYDFTIFPFKDDEQISDWAKTSVAVLYESLIIDGTGNGNFSPKENVTRAQAAKMIVGVIDYKY